MRSYVEPEVSPELQASVCKIWTFGEAQMIAVEEKGRPSGFSTGTSFKVKGKK